LTERRCLQVLVLPQNMIQMTTTRNYFACTLLLLFITTFLQAQTKQDSIAIKQIALDYIESQHQVNPKQMERALHNKMVKRTFWKNTNTNKEYLRETSRETMIRVAKNYNTSGNKFPNNPKKEVIILDIYDKTASVKLIADDWIDYMHIVKINNKWTIVNVLWQYNNSSKH
jgi:hypothetical protein